MEKSIIDIRKVSLSFGEFPVLKEFDLSVRRGEIVCITGPSGCGKSTLLNLVAGILKPDSGSIEIASGATMAYAFQEPRLLPWKTVAENIALAIPESVSAEKRLARVNRWLEVMELTKWADAWPSQMSGGMNQRTSLARALAKEADILLLDEPFSALDRDLKSRITGELSRYWKSAGTTVIMVTHDPLEISSIGGRSITLE